MNTKKIYCINCNKLGHNVKECSEPIYSYGIICMKILPDVLPSPFMIETYLINKTIDIDNYNYFNLSNITKIDKYKDKIKFLLIQRKHSFSYVDFIRGKYDEHNKEELISLLNLMSSDEIENIINNNFNYLWTELWQKTSRNKIYQKEFELSNKKFDFIKTIYNLYELIDFKNLYDSPEWGFPKGRRDRNEKNLDCAVREFEEETGLDLNKYLVLNRLNTVEESVTDSQNNVYKLIYYLGIAFEENELLLNNEFQKYEIGDMKWLSYEEIIPKIRSYYEEKITLIHKVYFMMVNILENIKKMDETHLI